ncbi:MAG: type VII secretion protein EccB [Propioniciclava sp.]
MPSNKDILEAQRYNRRRLLTAFMSGIDGEGHEYEPRSQTRPLVIGVVLTVILIAVGLVLGRMAPRLPNNWENSTLVLQQGSGARMLTIDGVLRPVTNTTSARLLSEPGRFQVVTLPAAALSEIPRGTPVGLTDAPDAIPLPEDLHSEVWAACATSDGRQRTWVGAPPDGLTPKGLAVVSVADDLYLVTEGAYHLIRRERGDDRVRIALQLDQAPVHPVSGAWLSLFTRGSDLAPLVLPREGEPTADMPPRLQGARVGSLLEVSDGETARHFLIVGDGQIASLSDTAYRLAAAALERTSEIPLTGTMQDVAELELVEVPDVPQDWPATLAEVIPEGERVCGQFVTTAAGPATILASRPAPKAADPEPEPAVTVAGGSGALVRGVSGGTLGSLHLVTDQGVTYGLGEANQDALARLGYTPEDVTVLPAPWLSLIPSGAVLTPEAAWATVKKS